MARGQWALPTARNQIPRPCAKPPPPQPTPSTLCRRALLVFSMDGSPHLKLGMLGTLHGVVGPLMEYDRTGEFLAQMLPHVVEGIDPNDTLKVRLPPVLARWAWGGDGAREQLACAPSERSDPTQHAKGRMGDRPGPRKGTATRRNVTRGVGRAPQRRGEWSGKGALVTGQSQEAGLKPLMMTHQLRRKAARKIVFSKNIPPLIRTSK